jgi:coenzyme PQQ precursor peptide PqqA
VSGEKLAARSVGNFGMRQCKTFKLNRSTRVIIFFQRRAVLAARNGGIIMTWSNPVIIEICVGMEITSYDSAEI